MKGAIATPHEEATRAGLEAFASGGNAVDAALAAAAVLAVVYPHQCSIGGDLFAVVSSPQNGEWAVNGSGACPAELDPTRLRASFAEMPDAGPEPVTVPGAVAAWGELAGRGARLGLAAAIGHAAGLAESGFPVSRGLAAGIRSRLDPIQADPGMRSIFTDDGAPLREGDRLTQPALAQTLRQIQTGGTGALYGGPIGEAFARGLGEKGSPLTSADLASHSTIIEPPLELELGSYRLLTAAPNSQGFVLLSMLAGLGPDSLSPTGFDAREAARASLLGMEDRDRWLGDPRHSKPPLDSLLDPDYASARLRSARRFAQNATSPSGGDTVAVVAIDEEGWSISLIQSVFQTFGAVILETATGIICQNRGRGFSFRSGAPNELSPGTRPAHTLVPLLVAAGCKVVAALGTMGGRAQPQILAQILPGALDAARPLDDTLTARRWVIGQRDIGFERVTAAVESGATDDLLEELAGAGVPVAVISRFDERSGHAQVVRRGAEGLEAASDPRSDGAAGSAFIPMIRAADQR